MRLFWLFYLSLVWLGSLAHAEDEWEVFKSETLALMEKIPGWCSKEKASLMMDIIHEKKFECCVEVGVFAGKSLLPIARALQFNQSGKVIGIDAWDSFEAIKGYDHSDTNYTWWGQVDLEGFSRQALSVISKYKLGKYAKAIVKPSRDAASLFKDGEIDFIHFDGNHSEKGALQDVVAFFPKVKEGGYILLNDSDWETMKPALGYLQEHGELVSELTTSIGYCFFFKKEFAAEEDGCFNSEQ